VYRLAVDPTLRLLFCAELDTLHWFT